VMMMSLRRRMEDAKKRVSKEELEADLVRRWLVLRKAGRIEVVCAEYGRFFVCKSEYDLWGTRWPITLAEFQRLIEEAESVPKPVQSEGCPTGRRNVHLAE
jgi:hypothetical protein